MKLENGRLKITFTNPADMTSPRFAHAGFITDVLLDDKWQFCMPEQLLPDRRNSKGCGLSGEFVLSTGELAKKGEWFFKPGVGLVKQTADFQRFNIFGTYKVKAFPVIIEHADDQSITFFQKGTVWNGYGADIRKIYRLQENQLILTVEVTNTGTENFELSEYQHNFVSLNQIPAGPGYQLMLPCDKNLNMIEQATLRQGDEHPMPSAVCVQGDTVHWKETLDNRILYHESYSVHTEAPAYWILKHENSPISIQENVNFTPSMIIVWAVEHCICAELYHTVQLTPGESTQWQRTWTFEN